MLPPFENQPLIDFTVAENRSAMEKAIEKVRSEFGKEYLSYINGKFVKGEKTFQSLNPSNPSEVVGIFNQPSVDDAVAAVEKSYEFWNSCYRWMPPAERAMILLKAARIMRERKLELDATMVLEEGKNWIEADADTNEAIDFLEFYAREMIRYSQRDELSPLKGEHNELRYIPLGVGIVIPPWNFPLAILAGMTTGALVAGNTVILKPSSDSPLIGYKFLEIMLAAGLPPEALSFITGSGSKIGNPLVAHPKTRFISFTGSKDVGCHINELAAKVQPGQIWLKRVLVEMGGKDFVAVDKTADLAAAAEGIVTSAYGFQGQKCSAGSRAIIHQDVYDELLEMIVERTKKITIGDPAVFENYEGPVINKRSEENTLAYIEIGKKEGRIACGGKKVDGLPGYFIEPTVIADVAPDARVAQEEIFAPVLTVIKAKDIDEIIKITNSTEYGLTGAIYSQDRWVIDRAKREMFVGNLYINRKCTGALVDVHPFGGFNMSGTDAKAGGRDYLFWFLQGKSITEKL